MFQLIKYLSCARRLSALALAGFALNTVGCGSDVTAPPTESDLIGTHQMVTINDHTVPHTFTDAAGSQLSIFDGELTFYDDGWYDLTYTGKLNSNEFELGDSGTYTVSGAVITFESDWEDEVYVGSFLSGTISMPQRVAGVMFDMGFKVE